jgi:outer membrane protein
MPHFLRLNRLAIGALLVLGGTAQAQNLVEVFEAARSFDATILAARSQFDASVARAAQARAGLLPQLGLSGGANLSHRDLSPSITQLEGSSNSQRASLAASHPVYRPAQWIAYDQAQLSLDVAKAQLATAEQDLIVRTTQAYFDVLAAQETLAFVKAQKTAVAEQLAAAKRNFEVGTSTVTDSREAQARFDLVLAQEIATENDLRIRQLVLDQLVGRPVVPRPLAAPVTLPPLLPADPEAWVRQAEGTHPALVQATRNLEIAQLEIRKAETGHKATLDLVGQYEVARGPSSNNIKNYARSGSASVGVQFNLPLFTGYAVQNRVRETVALEEVARTNLEGARRTINQATRSAYLGVLSGQGQVRALEAAEASSQSALDANKLGYQVGVRINIDVLNAQSQLFQTKRDLAVARYNVLLGGLRLKQASGQLSPADLQPVNALLAR